MVSSRQIAISFYKVLGEHKDANKNLADVLIEYLEEGGLMNLLPQVVAHLENLHNQDVVHSTLEIEISDKESAKVLESIHKKFGDPKKVNHKVNADLIGGFVATYKGFIYDASIKNQLKLLKNKLIAN